MSGGEAATGRLLAKAGLRHDEAQLALATAFTGRCPDPALERLDEASRALFPAATVGVREQADALAEQLAAGLRLLPDDLDHRALLLDWALERRRVQPLTIAVVGHELACRAGIPCFVGVAAGRHFTVVHNGSEMALVGCELPATPPLPAAVRPCCPHELAHAVLLRIGEIAPPAWRRRAERLLGALPLRRCARGS